MPDHATRHITRLASSSSFFDTSAGERSRSSAIARCSLGALRPTRLGQGTLVDGLTKLRESAQGSAQNGMTEIREEARGERAQSIEAKAEVAVDGPLRNGGTAKRRAGQADGCVLSKICGAFVGKYVERKKSWSRPESGGACGESAIRGDTTTLNCRPGSHSSTHAAQMDSGRPVHPTIGSNVGATSCRMCISSACMSSRSSFEVSGSSAPMPPMIVV